MPPYVNEKCDNAMPVLYFWNYAVKRVFGLAVTPLIFKSCFLIEEGKIEKV